MKAGKITIKKRRVGGNDEVPASSKRARPNPSSDSAAVSMSDAVVDFESYDEEAKAATAAAGSLRKKSKRKDGRFGSAALNSMNIYEGRAGGKKVGVAPKTSSVGELGGFGGGAGFADAMSKLLGGAIGGKADRTSAPLQISSNPVIMSKRKTPNMRKLEQARDEEIRERSARRTKQSKDEIAHVRPSVKTYRYEKNLKKIATKGVVALFNAVAEAQRLQEEVVAKNSATSNLKNAKGENMNKSEFLDMLSKQTGADSNKEKASYGDATSSAGSTAGSDARPSYLRDDFMKGASIKHWDQEDSEADDNEDDSDEDNAKGDESASSDSDSD